MTGDLKGPSVADDDAKQEKLSSLRPKLSAALARLSIWLNILKHAIGPAILFVKAWTETLDKLQRIAVTVAIIGLLATLVQTASQVDRTTDTCRTISGAGQGVQDFIYGTAEIGPWYPCGSYNDETTATGDSYVEREEGGIPWDDVVRHLLKGLALTGIAVSCVVGYRWTASG